MAIVFSSLPQATPSKKVFNVSDSLGRMSLVVRILAMMEPVSELKSMRAVQDKLVTMATKAVLYVPSRRNDKNRQY